MPLAKQQFLTDAAGHVRDTGHRALVRKALGGFYPSRDRQKARDRDREQARDAASLATWSAVNRLDDLAVLLPMLATAGAGQPMTCSNTRYAGPRRPGECDGPEEMHLVLRDNQRTAILVDEPAVEEPAAREPHG